MSKDARSVFLLVFRVFTAICVILGSGCSFGGSPTRGLEQGVGFAENLWDGTAANCSNRDNSTGNARPLFFEAFASGVRAAYSDTLKTFNSFNSEPSCRKFSRNLTAIVIDEGKLFAQTADLRCVVFDLQTGDLLNSTTRIATRVHAIAARGDSVLFGGVDGVVYRWWWRGEARVDRKGAPKQIERYIGHASSVDAIVWHPSGTTFFSGDITGGVNAWQVFEVDQFGGGFDVNKAAGDLFTAKAVRTPLGRSNVGDPITHLKLSRDGEMLAIATAEPRVELWATQGLVALDSKKLPDAGAVSALELLDSGGKVAVLDRAGNLFRFDVTRGFDRWGISESRELTLVRNEATNYTALVSDTDRKNLFGLNAEGLLARIN